jgi:hypothetical protein
MGLRWIADFRYKIADCASHMRYGIEPARLALLAWQAGIADLI